MYKASAKPKKIYFAGSIRGGRVDAALYQRIISYIQKTNMVLTEHVGHPNLDVTDTNKNRDIQIYNQDTLWLQESDLLIAECTCPSLGVGYELAYAERLNIPCHLFYNKTKTSLSAMLTGNKFYHIYPYENQDEIFPLLDQILER